jgi:hypothetical protein
MSDYVTSARRDYCCTRDRQEEPGKLCRPPRVCAQDNPHSISKNKLGLRDADALSPAHNDYVF